MPLCLLGFLVFFFLPGFSFLTSASCLAICVVSSLLSSCSFFSSDVAADASVVSFLSSSLAPLSSLPSVFGPGDAARDVSFDEEESYGE